jgi:CheY-like chemotaxis protein
MRTSILVVDDSPMIIHLVSSILEDYHMHFALNGQEAIEIIQSNPNIDLVLLDIEMPKMDGYEVIKILKSDAKTKDIPVIYLTVKDRRRTKSAGTWCG